MSWTLPLPFSAYSTIIESRWRVRSAAEVLKRLRSVGGEIAELRPRVEEEADKCVSSRPHRQHRPREEPPWPLLASIIKRGLLQCLRGTSRGSFHRDFSQPLILERENYLYRKVLLPSLNIRRPTKNHIPNAPSKSPCYP